MAVSVDSWAEYGTLCPGAGLTVPNTVAAAAETAPVRRAPWPVRTTWPPVTEPRSAAVWWKPKCRKPAALRPLTAIAMVTRLSLLRPVYRAWAGATGTAAACAAGRAGAALADRMIRVLATRRTAANATTAPSVIKGPRLFMPGYPPLPRTPPGAAIRLARKPGPKRSEPCYTGGLPPAGLSQIVIAAPSCAAPRCQRCSGLVDGERLHNHENYNDDNQNQNHNGSRNDAPAPAG